MGSDEMTDSDSRHHDVHHHQHQRKEETKGIPKGCVTVLVGNGDEEELERFVVPVVYVNHPLFSELLKEAEEEYGFDRKGPITIPCRVEEFRNVKGSIERERHSHDRHHQHHQDDHDHHHFLCFKA
ncbi:Auxin-responsive protein SAUR32-like protein [Drosera capensis]